jgi:DNA-binding beta-propeller fold protein YncE
VNTFLVGVLALAGLGSASSSDASPAPCDAGPKAIQEWKGIDARHPSFHTPTLIAVDPVGNVYLLDQKAYQLLEFSADGMFQKIWELPAEETRGDPRSYFFIAIAASDSFLYLSSRGVTFQYFKDGSIAQWNFGSCRNGLAVDRDGALYVSMANNRDSPYAEMGAVREKKATDIKERLDVLPENERGGIWRLSSDGRVLDHWDAPPWPIALGNDGTLYAIEPENGGALLRIKDKKTEIRMCQLGLESTTTLRSVAVSPQGHLFVNDYKKVVEADGQGNVLRRWCDPGPEYDLIDSPGNLTVGPQGHLYVVDYFKSRVLKFDLGSP